MAAEDSEEQVHLEMEVPDEPFLVTCCDLLILLRLLEEEVDHLKRAVSALLAPVALEYLAVILLWEPVQGREEV